MGIQKSYLIGHGTFTIIVSDDLKSCRACITWTFQVVRFVNFRISTGHFIVKFVEFVFIQSSSYERFSERILINKWQAR